MYINSIVSFGYLLLIATLTLVAAEDLSHVPFEATMRITEFHRKKGDATWETRSIREAKQVRSKDGSTWDDGILGPDTIRLFDKKEGTLYVWSRSTEGISSAPHSVAPAPPAGGSNGDPRIAVARRMDSIQGEQCYVYDITRVKGHPPQKKKIGEYCRSLSLNVILRFEVTHDEGDSEARHIAEMINIQINKDPDMSLFVPGARP